MTATGKTRTKASIEDRFWPKVKTGAGCWEWQASIYPKGYGQFGIAGKPALAHRVSWFIAHGEWPTFLVCHKCDNRKCVRPDHLFEGTHSDNIRDMDRKGRRPSTIKRTSEMQPFVTITEEIVRNMRLDYAQGGQSQIAIGRKYGVRKSMAHNILRGLSWKCA